ncbi:MAG: hypothetical protein U0694_21735 [Anaerolineae bacterium]
MDANSGGSRSFVRGDFSLHYFSFSAYQVERLQQGQIPLWNPYNYGGDPFAANVQWVTWYPPRWIAAALAGFSGGWRIESLQFEVAAHYWLVNWMTYLFLCALVKRKSAALAGSLLFTYGGYLTGYPMLQVSVIESVAWLPLLMLGVHKSITAASPFPLKSGWGYRRPRHRLILPRRASPDHAANDLPCAGLSARRGRMNGVSWWGILWRCADGRVGWRAGGAAAALALEFIRLRRAPA